MTQYLLAVHTGNEVREPMTEAEMAEAGRRIGTLETEMRQVGALVFSGRLTEPDAAKVVRPSEGAALTTDGPFAETKEQLGGFYIIEADDFDAALTWASKTTAVINMPIEVREFWASHGG